MSLVALKAVDIKVYHVFLASPGDVANERDQVRRFFERFNRNQASRWRVRFEVIDWENYATTGVGRPQALITEETLVCFRDSLALVIGLMAQRFGSPTGVAESGTEEEFNWALESHRARGFPDIKWFFREIDEFRAPRDPGAIREALEQWEKVTAFQRRLREGDPQVFYTSYRGPDDFGGVFADDLERWLCASARPWVQSLPQDSSASIAIRPPRVYFENLRQDFWRLDISGIDNDRAFDIPLSEVYVRLRVTFESDPAPDPTLADDGPLDIRTALNRYSKLAIVGDPGSGKSTFLKFIALTLAQAELDGDDAIVLERLSLTGTLPVPVFLSCWGLSDFLRRGDSNGTPDDLLCFIETRLHLCQFDFLRADLEILLQEGRACILFDGLDEVPSDQGRDAVSRLLERFVKRYHKNRYVVTSRVRAYTGDTVLRGGFARCDIQPFDAQDRANFLRNWTALLFRLIPGEVAASESEAGIEYRRLTSSIERNGRIRALALNPLLLTVIALVHWNRKRLPEQRVDLYDECVDVLLGQRKDAEHVRVARLSAVLDETREDERHEERAWTRKRFGEIALHIQSQAGTADDAGKADLIRLVTPRFQVRYGVSDDQARSRAERFLDRHELRSGLLVSHRAQNYRFVHLTFQEYLAAWVLSNMEFAEVTERVGGRLRDAKWFETLQLLGGIWAKESDEKVDRYLGWLLDQQEDRIARRAPVVALCANLSRDIEGIAAIKAETRYKLYTSLKDTLHAFRRASGVALQMQLEILEALGTLGAAVKKNLLEATSASRYQVRVRAIEMLLPHLSEDELFGMTWVFQDRAREPVAAYLLALLKRNSGRALGLFRETSHRSQLSSAFYWILSRWRHGDYWNREVIRPLIEMLAAEPWPCLAEFTPMELLARSWGDERARSLVWTLATESPHESVRREALEVMARRWREKSFAELLLRLSRDDPSPGVRARALESLVWEFKSDPVRVRILESAVADESDQVRKVALDLLERAWSGSETDALIKRRASEDMSPDLREYAKGRVTIARLRAEAAGSTGNN